MNNRHVMSSREKLPARVALRADSATRAVIDMADGIDRIMGNRELYARMLKRFRSDYAHGAVPIGQALAAGDAVLAQRLAHTLKGAAGMIGAHRLHQDASVLELAIRTDPPAQQAALNALMGAFDKVLHLLDQVVTGSAPDGFALDMPQRPLMQDPVLLARLVELLIDADGAAVDLLDESGASLRVILGDARLARVTKAVNDFDFEGALSALRQTAL
ncbi:Hpt domain-containing protein [Massilia sp. P8910]|uniref:Hpt domain-containing protein n=1 Tax=Massilia antarctica TaxID=2765360 RepID=UPI0009EC231F|nr:MULTISPECIES: Hpt domain-containing protein [Massilia]MCE3606948.1 Hpt domain-containing protein [Massilia antarctica]MCY0916106.1 Hpt domain-containing protein [Massilia sp. H27-R4]